MKPSSKCIFVWCSYSTSLVANIIDECNPSRLLTQLVEYVRMAYVSDMNAVLNSVEKKDGCETYSNIGCVPERITVRLTNLVQNY